MTTASRVAGSVSGLLREIEDTGVDPVRGGYSRPVFSPAELDLRSWFASAAEARGLEVTADRNGTLWAWWNPLGQALQGSVVTGSHLDSVPGGGQYDGPLGVASALVAVDHLVARGIRPHRPLALAVFSEEEGSRFGLACLGSQLMTGAISPDRARNLRDETGRSFAEVCAASGLNPALLGRDEEALGHIGAFVELHVEQGRGLIDAEQAVAVGSSILGHGRWKLSILGEGNHAGTTLMTDRRDPMVAAARTIVAIRDTAAGQEGARATVGRVRPVPGGTNVIASRVDLWVDVRHADDAVTTGLVAEMASQAAALAEEEGCSSSIVEESYSPRVSFSSSLGRQLSAVLPQAPVLATGAGHDAGVLAAEVPTAMLFVRNPSGISHSPEEHVEDADADQGAVALADCLGALLIADRL